ncbi:MAG TPA: 2-phosphosulfolactate phosphatase [Microbacterium sp.]|nr:2-phosphosulfolactate phosphatase [Microbacterium sp.]
MPSSFDQSRYQVRLEHGVDGLRRLATSDVVVVVDVLDVSRHAIDAAAAGAELAVAALGDEVRSMVAAASASSVLVGGLRNARAVAAAILAEQERRGQRTSVALVASTPRGRFAVENQLAAGAIIDGLAARGIDHSSPEAAVACEGFRALRGAVRHMVTAAGNGQLLVEEGLRDAVLAQTRSDDTDAVPALHGDHFSRL